MTTFNKLKIMSEVILLLPNTDYYQILTAFNKLKMIILLLPNTDRLQQIEDYVRGYTTSTKY